MRAMRRAAAVLATAAWLVSGLPARADNAMGYRVLTATQAAQLPQKGGSLGMEVQRAERITDAGLAFDLIRVSRVQGGSAGARAGFRAGDTIVALDGQVFESLKAFAGYVHSLGQGTQASVDYIPAGGGPGQAQRVSLTIGGAASGGLSTGQKVAIGVGAAALFGCYELGCFTHRQAQPQ